MPTRIQYSSVVGLVGPLGPVETLLPVEHGPGLCPHDRFDPMIALSPVEGLERDCVEVGEENITVPSGWSGPDVARTHAVVAMVEMEPC